MGTRCNISIENNQESIIKFMDGTPQHTIVPILCFVSIFGWDTFNQEFDRIKSFGSCNDFFTMYRDWQESDGFFDLLNTKHITNSISKDTKDYSADYKYDIYKDKIVIHSDEKYTREIPFNINDIKKIIIDSVFTDIELLHVKIKNKIKL